jgi:histone H1/5
MATASKKPTEVKAAAPVIKKAAAPKVAAPKVAVSASVAEKKVAAPKAKVAKAVVAEKPAPVAKVAAEKPAKKVAPKKKAASASASAVSPEHRYHMIATAAYFIAQNRGSASGYEMQDWITAEAQIDLQLSSVK